MPVVDTSSRVAEFFEYARKRHQIYLDREAGKPAPWTDDPILQKYRFTCIFREDDRVTKWFREKVRDPLKNKPEVLLATVVFRLFNRVTTGEAIFCQQVLDSSVESREWLFGTPCPTAFDLFCLDGDIRHLKRAIIALVGKKGKVVTGSYIISSPSGKSKLDGVLWVLGQFWKNSEWEWVARGQRENLIYTSLEKTWKWLKDQPYVGPFHAYEIVSDLRWTHLLENAEDILTWANPGPGARRGLNRLRNRDLKDHSTSREKMIWEMGQVLMLSRSDPRMWPKNWPKWELRECEHQLCEFDKYERARLGEGRPRQIFRGGK